MDLIWAVPLTPLLLITLTLTMTAIETHLLPRPPHQDKQPVTGSSSAVIGAAGPFGVDACIAPAVLSLPRAGAGACEAPTQADSPGVSD